MSTRMSDEELVALYNAVDAAKMSRIVPGDGRRATMRARALLAARAMSIRHEPRPVRVAGVRPTASDTVQASDTVSCTALVHVPSDTKASDTVKASDMATDKARARRARYDQSLKGKAARAIRRATR